MLQYFFPLFNKNIQKVKDQEERNPSYRSCDFDNCEEKEIEESKND